MGLNLNQAKVRRFQLWCQEARTDHRSAITSALLLLPEDIHRFTFDSEIIAAGKATKELKLSFQTSLIFAFHASADSKNSMRRQDHRDKDTVQREPGLQQEGPVL